MGPRRFSRMPVGDFCFSLVGSANLREITSAHPGKREIRHEQRRGIR
jgi:hypothetical protein